MQAIIRTILITGFTLLCSCSEEKNLMVGTWKNDDVTYVFYEDGSGCDCDSIEGDTIISWWLRDGKLFIKSDPLYPSDTDSMYIKFTEGGKEFVMNGKYRFRKIE